MYCSRSTGVGSTPAFAHHPFSSEFDANAPVHLTGKVAQVNWNSPHVLIFMTAAAANGDQIWTLEAASSGSDVKSEMHRYKRGTAKSGPGGGGGKVKSRKQAIVIGLSKARKKGKKVPAKKK